MLAPDQSLECVRRFDDEIADIKKRWDDRFPVKGRSWAEGYLDGHLWITVEGNFACMGDNYSWFARITTSPAVEHGVSSEVGVNAFDVGYGDSRNSEIVFVVNVDGPEGPQLVASVVDGPSGESRLGFDLI